MRISHEAIYQALFAQSRAALRRNLTACLRSGRALRVPRARVCSRQADKVHYQRTDHEELLLQEPRSATGANQRHRRF